VVLAAVGAWVWSQASPSPTAGVLRVPVHVVGQGGREVFNGTVVTANATALSALQAAGRAGHFAVVLRDYAGYGSCGAYVASVAGQGEQGTGGWVYRVWSPAEGWSMPPRSAACTPLGQGERLEWAWSDAPA